VCKQFQTQPPSVLLTNLTTTKELRTSLILRWQITLISVALIAELSLCHIQLVQWILVFPLGGGQEKIVAWTHLSHWFSFFIIPPHYLASRNVWMSLGNTVATRRAWLTSSLCFSMTFSHMVFSSEHPNNFDYNAALSLCKNCCI